MGDIFTTCFCSKGPPSGSTQIKFTITSYWCMIGLYIYIWDLLFTIKWFIMKGNLGVYRHHLYCGFCGKWMSWIFRPTITACLTQLKYEIWGFHSSWGFKFSGIWHSVIGLMFPISKECIASFFKGRPWTLEDKGYMLFQKVWKY